MTFHRTPRGAAPPPGAHFLWSYGDCTRTTGSGELLVVTATKQGLGPGLFRSAREVAGIGVGLESAPPGTGAGSRRQAGSAIFNGKVR